MSMPALLPQRDLSVTPRAFREAAEVLRATPAGRQVMRLFREERSVVVG